MNSKSFSVILGVVIVVLIGAAVYFATIRKAGQPATPAPAAQPTAETANSNSQPAHATNISYLVSKEEKTKFCNGENMDSEGYRKTITTEVVSDVPSAGLTETELVKETAVLATDGMCQTVLKNTDFTVANGIVEISPIEGWAGVSIVMCYCKPQVEVNLLRIPGIKQVVWSSN